MRFFKGVLKSVFDAALAGPIAAKNWRSMVFITPYALAPELRGLAKTPLRSLKHLLRVYRHRGDISELAILGNRIDDILDSMSPRAVAHAGSTPDAFLANPAVVPPEYHAVMARLWEAGIVSQDYAQGCARLFAHLSQKKAQFLEAANHTHSQNLRMHAAGLNLELSCVYMSMFFGFVVPDPDLQTRNAMFSERLRTAYPQVYNLTTVLQYGDDLRDLIIDLQDEANTGHMSPNIILANAFKSNAERLEAIQFVREIGREPHIGVDQLPPSLRAGLHLAQEQYFRDVAGLRGFFTRNILEAVWRDSVREGFQTQNHPAYLAKHESEAVLLESVRTAGARARQPVRNAL